MSGPPAPEIPGYICHELIGNGASAEVWRATRVDDESAEYAIKVLASRWANSEMRDRFEEEGELLQEKLSHPNLVRCHERGEVAEQLYMVLDFVSGGDLEPIASAGPLAPRKGAGSRPLRGLLENFAQLCDVLQHLHDEEVIHRDVKPENVRLDADGNAVLLDLGVARSFARRTLTEEGVVVGTPTNMSPEQATGGRVLVDHRTDIFSIGTSLYFCLSGRYPFDGRDQKQIYGAILSGDYLPLRKARQGIPIDLDTIVSGCLAHRPHDRYSSAADVARDIRLFLDGKPIVRKRAGIAARTYDWVRRHPVPVLVLCLAMLAGYVQYSAYVRARADWVTVTFVEAEARELELEIRPHREEFLEFPTFRRARVDTGDEVRLPPNRIFDVTARGGGVAHRLACTVLTEYEGAELPFCIDDRRADCDHYVHLPVDPPLWLRVEPVSIAEQIALLGCHEEWEVPARSEWQGAQMFLGQCLDPPWSSTGFPQLPAGSVGPVPQSTLTVASTSCALLGGRLIGGRDLDRLVDHLEAGAPGWTAEEVEAVASLIRRPALLLQVVSEQESTGTRLRTLFEPDQDTQEWRSRDPMFWVSSWTGRFEPEKRFATEGGTLGIMPARALTILVRDEPPGPRAK